jgi:hypothetical protein
MYYQDADDRPLSDIEDDMDIDYLDGEILINEDIKLPIFVVNGVPYYD